MKEETETHPSPREAEARTRLLEAAAELEALRSRLAGIHDGLPVSSREEVMHEGEEEMDVTTEIRSVIECVLNDSIQPAIRDLRAAADYRLPERARKERRRPEHT